MIDDLCRAIIAQAKCEVFVETGLYLGETIAAVSTWFSELYPDFGRVTGWANYGVRGAQNPWNSLVPYPSFFAPTRSEQKIISIELDQKLCDQGRAIFRSNPNIQFICESSELALEHLVKDGKLGSSPFVYLDAHWNDYWPLLDELKVLFELERVIVVIDDFEVPNRPEWGFDLYKGKPCGLELIRDFIERSDVSAYFPVRANRDNRGWVVLFKGYGGSEAAWMQALPMALA